MEIYKYTVCTKCITYNQQQYIIDALDGFTSQRTSFPIIYVIVDDASTDDTPNIIRKYVVNYFNTQEIDGAYEQLFDYGHVIYAQHKTNKNCFFSVILLSENHYRNKKTKSPYIKPWLKDSKYTAICEGDDYWIDPLKLQKQVDYLESHPECSLCFHAHESVYVDPSKNHPTYPKFKSKNGIYHFNKLIAGGGGFMATNSMVYKSTYDQSMPQWTFKYHIGDLFIMLWLGHLGYAYYINEVMSAYRISANGSWTAKREAVGIKQTTKYYFDDCKMWWEIWKWQKGKYPLAFLYRYAMTTYVYLRTIFRKIIKK